MQIITSSIHKFLRLIVVTAILLALLLTGAYFLIKSKAIAINHYFLPENAILGADISEYQGTVDMNQLASQGLKFIYIKATEGSSHIDEKFEENWQNAKSSPLYYGAYHFFSFDSPGKTQADNFIKTVGPLTDESALVPVVDVEYYAEKKENPPEKSTVKTELKAFLDALEQKYHVRPIIYSSKEIYTKYLRDDFASYSRWASNFYLPIYLDTSSDWLLWQYTDRGELNGFDGHDYIDLNVLNPTASLETLKVNH